MPSRRPPALLLAAAVAFGLGACSLVLEDPTPFVEARRDMAVQDRGPLLPDLAVEDAFVARRPLDMAPEPEPEPDMAEPEPDAALDPEPDADVECLDGGCADGGV